jgi:uncharacterized membrane protein YphA (DoxX/SURF4 family)
MTLCVPLSLVPLDYKKDIIRVNFFYTPFQNIFQGLIYRKPLVLMGFYVCCQKIIFLQVNIGLFSPNVSSFLLIFASVTITMVIDFWGNAPYNLSQRKGNSFHTVLVP